MVKNDLAYLLAHEGRDLKRALDLAREAYAELGDDAQVAHTLGYVYLKKGRTQAALRYLQYAAALSAMPNPELQYDLGLALARLGQIDQAVAAFDRAYQISPAYMQSDEGKKEVG